MEKEIIYKRGKSIIRFTKNTPTVRGFYLYLDEMMGGNNIKIKFTDIMFVELYPSIGGLWIRENETCSLVGHLVKKYDGYFSKSLFNEG